MLTRFYSRIERHAIPESVAAGGIALIVSAFPAGEPIAGRARVDDCRVLRRMNQAVSRYRRFWLVTTIVTYRRQEPTRAKTEDGGV